MNTCAVKPVCQVSFDVGFTQEIITDYIAHTLARFACDDWKELKTPCDVSVSADTVLNAEEGRRCGIGDNNWLDEVCGSAE
jgi:hypothetical protein